MITIITAYFNNGLELVTYALEAFLTCFISGKIGWLKKSDATSGIGDW